jgi:hypothetical protein
MRRRTFLGMLPGALAVAAPQAFETGGEAPLPNRPKVPGKLGLRARIAGWRCVYTPRAVARHHRGSTLGRDSGWRLKLIERNRVLSVKLFPWSRGGPFSALPSPRDFMARRGEG